jgi:hypothetical protein
VFSFCCAIWPSAEFLAATNSKGGDVTGMASRSQ